jgi:hypothetical protein
MNKESFDLAFGHSKPKHISKPQSCGAVSGDKMSSCGVFDVIQELNENISGIDFIYAYRLLTMLLLVKLNLQVPEQTLLRL